MTQPSVTITHPLINGGAATPIYCSQVSAGNKRSVVAKPNANVDAPVEVQGKAVENRKITIQRVMFDTTATTITATELENLLSLEYDGTNAPILTVTYGKSIPIFDGEGVKTGNEPLQTLKAMDGTSTNIPVILESYTYPIDVTTSNQGYMPEGSLIFIETIPNS